MQNNPEYRIGIMTLSLQMTLERIKVPLATFDSINVIRRFPILPPSEFAGINESTAWYAQHIGLIKRIQEEESWELNWSSNSKPSQVD